MEILFLGTAAAEGIPGLFCRCDTCLNAEKSGAYDLRTRCGYLINRHLMIDITPDIMLHKRLYNLDLAAVDTFCITHSHTDHLNIADLCFRSTTTMHYATIPDEKPIVVYANKKSCEKFELTLTEALGGRKLSAVSMDCTFCLKAGKASHMGVAENITLKKRLLNASHKELTEALSPHGIAPAYDGMVLNL